MSHPDEATIYLADLRGCSQSEEYRSFHTFNYGSYFDQHREPFGSLRAINDDTLKAGCAERWEAIEDTRVTIVPLIGMLRCTDGSGGDHIVDAGEVVTFFVEKGSFFSVSNPFRGALINFLHIWTTVHSSANGTAVKSVIDFGMHNQLSPLVTGQDVSIMIGKFDGRIEETLSVANADHGVFVYIIDGAFEVQGRLLDARDALALRKSEILDFEALSSEGIILLIQEGRV